jgi:hypothetical protein
MKKLAAGRISGKAIISPSNINDIKIYHIEGSAIGVLVTSATGYGEITLIPVVIDGVDGVYKVESVLIKPDNVRLNISLFIHPQAFLWLVSESENGAAGGGVGYLPMKM